MKNKQIKAFSVAVLCAVLICTLLCSCDSTKAPEPTENTVLVRTEGGMALSDVGIYVYKDSSCSQLVWAGTTDKEGKAVFTAGIPEECVAVLKEYPESYAVNSEYPVNAGHTEISLKAEITEGDIGSLQLKRGSIMTDFTLKAVTGEEYRLSELLKEKKAVVLNFWFMNCEPCKMEFPHMEAAYGKYKDTVELIAVNTVDGTEAEINGFAKERQLSFPMVKATSEWESAFNIRSFPTTVVIDRYGMICLISEGSIPETETFEKLFAYFTAEDYTQRIIKNINDIE